MKRRSFIAGLGSAAAWPVVARAQQRIPVVGVLGVQGPEVSNANKPSFIQALRATLEGKWLELLSEIAPRLKRPRREMLLNFDAAK